MGRAVRSRSVGSAESNRWLNLANRHSLDYFKPLTILFSGAGYVDRLQQIFAHRYKYLTDRLAVIFTYKDFADRMKSSTLPSIIIIRWRSLPIWKS